MGPKGLTFQSNISFEKSKALVDEIKELPKEQKELKHQGTSIEVARQLVGLNEKNSLTKGIKIAEVENQIEEKENESEATSFVTEIHTDSQLTSFKSKKGSNADASHVALEKLKTSQIRLDTISQANDSNSAESKD